MYVVLVVRTGYFFHMLIFWIFFYSDYLAWSFLSVIYCVSFFEAHKQVSRELVYYTVRVGSTNLVTEFDVELALRMTGQDIHD